MTRQRSKYIKIIPDSKPMKSVRQRKQKLPLDYVDFSHFIRYLFFAPSRAELMKAYQKGWDDRKAYEVANAKHVTDLINGKLQSHGLDMVIFPMFNDGRLNLTHPDNDPKSIIHKHKKSWKAKK